MIQKIKIMVAARLLLISLPTLGGCAARLPPEEERNLGKCGAVRECRLWGGRLPGFTPHPGSRSGRAVSARRGQGITAAPRNREGRLDRLMVRPHPGPALKRARAADGLLGARQN
jgi:hypothetical protein